MPWHIETGHPHCGGYAVVKDATGELEGCHATRADARRQLAALNIAEAGDRSLQRAEGYTPTESMREEAQRGLTWRAEYGRGGTLVGVARARDIINGRQLSLSTVRRMSSYFARHEVDKQGSGYQPGEEGYPSAGRIAWALWGGDPGRTWAQDILASVEVRQQLEDDTTENNDEHGLVVDIDGTLVTYDGTPRPAVVEFVREYEGPIFVVSGRPIADRVETRKQIDSLGIDYEAIFLKTQSSTLEHKRQTVDRLMRLHGIDAAIDNDAAVREIYSELGVEHVIDPNDLKNMARLEHARRLVAYLLH